MQDLRLNELLFCSNVHGAVKLCRVIASVEKRLAKQCRDIRCCPQLFLSRLQTVRLLIVNLFAFEAH